MASPPFGKGLTKKSHSGLLYTSCKDTIFGKILKHMESKYNYLKRDISWLSYNYRVLLEALDEHQPLYERINFISIYSSNLE